jgi:hypothetical protein
MAKKVWAADTVNELYFMGLIKAKTAKKILKNENITELERDICETIVLMDEIHKTNKYERNYAIKY